MLIELLGGPFDGAVCEGPKCLSPYLVAANHTDEPLYKRACCKCCAGGKMAVPYRFAGYQREEIQPAQKEQFMGMLLSPKNDSQSEKN